MFEGIDGRIAEGDDEINPLCDELFGKSRYSVVPSTSPYELKPDVSFLVPTKRPHIASKRFGEDFIHILGIDAQHAEYRHCRLLSARCNRPRCCRAAECDQQFPPSDGDCHTPLPREVRKGNDTTSRACCP